MRIHPLINRKYNRAPNFKEDKKIYDKQGRLLYRTKTFFFRSDLDWKGLADYLVDKYKDASKVNIIDHACSYGKEPYSIAISLIEHLGTNSSKFFPIKARDINSTNIEYAKSGFIGITNNDLYHINFFTGDKTGYYFDYEKSSNYKDDLFVKPKAILKDKVEFQKSNILNDKHYIQPRNTVLFCRNFWPYLKINERVQLAEMLKNHIGKNSVIIIGDYDKEFGVGKLLDTYGFRELPFLENVFEKN